MHLFWRGLSIVIVLKYNLNQHRFLFENLKAMHWRYTRPQRPREIVLKGGLKATPLQHEKVKTLSFVKRLKASLGLLGSCRGPLGDPLAGLLHCLQCNGWPSKPLHPRCTSKALFLDSRILI